MQKKNLETVLYSTVGVIVMAGILVAVNVITSSLRARVDLTKEKAFTLSEGTKQILGRLDTPVKIRFYCTQTDDSTPYTVLLNSHARRVEDLLEEFRQAAKGKLIIERFDPQPDSDVEENARMNGLEEQMLPDGEKFYLGLSVSQLDTKEAIPFLQPDRERQLEYDLARAITRVVTPERPVVGVMSALPVFGQQANPMMMQMGQRGQEPWAIISELRRDYTLRNVPLETEKIEDDVKVLLVIHPKGISETTHYAIDQFILRGGRLIAFMDSQSLVDSANQNPMMRQQMPSGGSSLDKLIAAWGLQFDVSKVAADRTFKMELGDAGDRTQQRPAWLMLNTDAINADDVATATLDNVWYFSGGVFTGTAAAGLKQTVLLKTSKDSQLVDGMMANFGADAIMKDFKSSGVEYALAVRLTGKFKTAFPNGKPEEKPESGETNAVASTEASLKEGQKETAVILVGDADLINDGFAIRRMNTPFGALASPLNGNLNFAQNLIEQASGDSALIAVRSRAALNRPFIRIRDMQKQAEEKYMAEINRLQESRDQAMARLNELQQQKSGNQKFILSPEQEAELNNLREKEAQIGKQLRQVKKDLRRDVVGMQRRIQWVNILTIPIAVGIVGIALAVFKHKRTSAK